MSEDFLQVYEEYVWRIYGYFAYRLRSRADAEDLTQVTFERAFAAWDRYDPDRADVSTWLFAIARNALTDHSRRIKVRPRSSRSIEDVGEAELPATEGPEERLGMDPALAAALGRLSRRERGILALRFGGDLRGPEIAELTGLTVANVHQILSRALRRMRSLLEAEQGREDPPGAGATGSGGPRR
jgi:RNA polymerase sigma-70 factor (ECF subfamily)